MRRLTIGLGLAGAVVLSSAAAVPLQAQSPQAGPDLATLWQAGKMLVDSNDDGFVDGLVWALDVGSSPSAAELAAAANIAARAGYETMALDLPIAASGVNGVLVRVRLAAQGGGTELVRRLSAFGDGGAPLQLLREGPLSRPGRGHIVITGSDDLHTVTVTGDDVAGLNHAALWLAGALPYLAGTSGPTLSDTAETLREGLAAAGVDAEAVAVRGLALDVGSQRVAKLLVAIETVAGNEELARQLVAASPSLQSLLPQSVDELLLWVPGGVSTVVSVIAGVTEEPLESDGPRGSRPGAGGHEELGLADLYGSKGLLGDRNDDLIVDRTDTVLSPGPGVGRGVLDLAARLGLESAGVVLPIAKAPEAIEDPEAEPTLVLIGSDHPLVQQLATEDRLLIPDLAPGEGYVQVVREAFGDKSAVVITGDSDGLSAALAGLAETWPNLGPRGKDRLTVGGLAGELRRFVALRSPAGQAAAAVYKGRRMLRDVPADARDIEVSLALDHAAAGLAEALRAAFVLPGGSSPIEVRVESLDVTTATEILDTSMTGRGEVEPLLDAITAELLPRMDGAAKVSVEARISEPLAVRQAAAQRIREKLLAAGAGDAIVTVLPAYKQGLGWLEEVIAPRLEGLDVGRIVIRFAESVPPPEWEIQALNTPTRWLLELFPIDEMLARQLEIQLEQVQFEMAPPDAPIYEVIVSDRSGVEVLRDTFEPSYLVQPYFSLFPRYEQVRVTTGWLRAEVGGELVVDRRLETDLEWVWRQYQDELLPRLYDYVMRLHEGKPRRDRAPHFGELRVEVVLSEPERPLGIDEERIAPMEALHEELYFGTLHFFDLLGRMASGAPLDYPGRVIPVVESRSDGGAGTVRFRLTGFSAPGPQVEISWLDAGGVRQSRRRALIPVQVNPPRALGASFSAGRPGISRLDLGQRVDSVDDERESLVARTSARRVDGQWMSATQLGAMLDNLAMLRGKGLYVEELAHEGLGGVRVHWSTGHHVDLSGSEWVDLAANGAPAALPDPRTLVAWPGGRNIVQWETPIPPDEAYAIIATMSAEFAAATTYKVGDSYLGREIWAMDLMAPLHGTHWSQGKATALKPTVVYSARQHANEVSSTSHVLKLAERLLTDPERADVLKRLNVVVHPITNPDGAQLAYDLYQSTPDHMLHAGYLGSLGVDVTAGSDGEDPLYPETKVRERLWRTWRPDIFLNPHGYPSHEWVQPFSEYAAWVRQRVTESRGWWGMRGWFMPGFAYVDDPKYPRHKEEAFAIRDYITQAIAELPDIVALNDRAYDRYRRYGAAHDPDTFKMDLADDVLIYTAIKGSPAGGSGFMTRNPKVTIWSGSTEAPDETAHGDWLRLVASAGLAWDEAILDYLLSREHVVERQQEAFAGGFDLHLYRERPGRRPDEESDS